MNTNNSRDEKRKSLEDKSQPELAGTQPPPEKDGNRSSTKVGGPSSEKADPHGTVDLGPDATSDPYSTVDMNSTETPPQIEINRPGVRDTADLSESDSSRDGMGKDTTADLTSSSEDGDGEVEIVIKANSPNLRQIVEESKKLDTSSTVVEEEIGFVIPRAPRRKGPVPPDETDRGDMPVEKGYTRPGPVKSSLLKRLVLILILSVITFAGGVYALYINLGRGADISAPEVGHLSFKQAEVTPLENAFTYLDRALEKMASTYDKEREQLRRQILTMIQSPRWEESLWEEVTKMKYLSRNREALEQIRRGLSCRRSQGPTKISLTPNVQPEYIGLLDHLGWVQAIAILKDMRSFHYERALDRSLNLIHYGYLLSRSQSAATPQGSSIQQLGMDLIRRILVTADFPNKTLREAVKLLEKWGYPPRAMEGMIQLQFGGHKRRIDKAARDEVFLLEPSRPLENSEYLTHYLLFQPNYTVELLAKMFQRKLEIYRLPYQQSRKKSRELIDFHQQILQGWTNYLGRRYFTHFFLAPAVQHRDDHRSIRYDLEVAKSATLILLAVKGYKNDHRKLPKTLSELVPKYLDTIPHDEFDGKAMGYDRKQEQIYSRGRTVLGPENLEFPIDF